MNYEIKNLKETDLAPFFLNPFERNARFSNVIIQKYAVTGDIDDFMCLDFYSCRFFRTGFVLYEKNQIIVEESNIIKSKLIDKAPFIRINTIKESIREKIEAYIQETRTYIKDTSSYGLSPIYVFIANLSDMDMVRIASGEADPVVLFLKELPNLS